jgi:hypothetical protein
VNLTQLQQWILSQDGLGNELDLLGRYSAVKHLGLARISQDIAAFEPDWQRLLFAGSVLSVSDSPQSNEMALMIAQAGLLYSDERRIVDASATILTQLSNHRALQLALERDYLPEGLEERLGVVEQMLFARRELSQSVFPTRGDAIITNKFQREFWNQLQRVDWISASAPTSSGKTYLVLQWLLNEFAVGNVRLSVFIAPTRALVGEIERELLDLASNHGIEDLRVSSLPLAQLTDGARPTILVFTQERLHVLLNAVTTPPLFDIAIIDEVQKLGDGLRGVILQDAIERVSRANPRAKLVFLSPLTKNPESLVENAQRGSLQVSFPTKIQW